MKVLEFRELAAESAANAQALLLPIPIPSLEARGRLEIRVVGSKEDLAAIGVLPTFGDMLGWSFNDHPHDASHSSDFTILVWSQALSDSVEILYEKAGLLLLYRMGDSYQLMASRYGCPCLEISDGIRDSLIQLIPSLYLSCNYEGLICADVDDIVGLLRNGGNLELFHRWGDPVDTINQSIAWVRSNLVAGRTPSGLCMGLYLSDSWIRHAPSVNILECLDSWVQRIELPDEAETLSIPWVVWHSGEGSLVTCLEVS
ncbi:MAG: hypothetical protein ACREPQ_09085 [Rhodanobacter sp.]